MKRVILICLICIGTVSCTSVSHETNAGTQADRFELHSEYTNVDYVIRVWAPRSYQVGDRDYPLLLMLDGEYSFESAVPIADYLQRSKEVKEFIVAAVSYDVGFGPPLAAKRTPDFTPPLDGNRTISKTASNYYNVLKDEIVPAIRSKYRIDQNDETLWGYSLSGTFAIWLNYFDRSAFDNYIIASPNTSYGILEKMLAGEIFNSDSAIAKKVMMSIDPSETPNPQDYFDLNTFLPNEALKNLVAGFKGYDFRVHATRGESHSSSWFASLPTSLRFIYGVRTD